MKPYAYCLGFVLLVKGFPPSLEPGKTLILIFILGLAGRALFLNYPYGDDLFRYVWEGYIQNKGFNPFLYSPDDPALSGIAHGDLSPVWQQINHQEFPAAYPPLSLLFYGNGFYFPDDGAGLSDGRFPGKSMA